MSNYPTAAIMVIGDEILSGRTLETNVKWLATRLTQQGIKLAEVRIVADDEHQIISTIHTLSKSFDLVFTSGGIGPTPDDITTASLAKAFNVPLVCHQKSFNNMAKLCHKKNIPFTKARQKMTIVPKGCEIIENTLTIAPGFKIANIYVLAGVPAIMKVMAESVIHKLPGGKPIISTSVHTDIAEGDLAHLIEKMLTKYPTLLIGSYPNFDEQKKSHTVELVLRHSDQNFLDKALCHIGEEIKKITSLN